MRKWKPKWCSQSDSLLTQFITTDCNNPKKSQYCKNLPGPQGNKFSGAHFDIRFLAKCLRQTWQKRAVDARARPRAHALTRARVRAHTRGPTLGTAPAQHQHSMGAGHSGHSGGAAARAHADRTPHARSPQVNARARTLGAYSCTATN